MHIMNVPVPFAGTSEESRINFGTHDFRTWGGDDDMDARCGRCDCKPWHQAAAYPCGTEPKRMVVVTEGAHEWRIVEGTEIPSTMPEAIADSVRTHLLHWGW